MKSQFYDTKHLVTTKNVQTILSAQELVQILIPLVEMLLFMHFFLIPEIGLCTFWW